VITLDATSFLKLTVLQRILGFQSKAGGDFFASIHPSIGLKLGDFTLPTGIRFSVASRQFTRRRTSDVQMSQAPMIPGHDARVFRTSQRLGCGSSDGWSGEVRPRTMALRREGVP